MSDHGWCSKCKLFRPLVGNSHYCRLCHADYVRQWYVDNKDSVRNTQFKRKYGITVDQYNILLESQNGKCAICKRDCSTGKRLSVDHDHDTGLVRGLLCTNCNQGLGKFKDDYALLALAMKYLEYYQ